MALTLLQMAIQLPPMQRKMIMSFLEGSESRILPLLNFVDSTEMAGYSFSTVDDLGEVNERSINGSYPDSDITTSPKHERLAVFGGAVTTDQLQIDDKGDVARLNRIDKKLKANGLYFDDMFFNGSSQANPKQFNGLKVRAVAKNRVLWTGANGGALTLDLLDEALDSVAGDNVNKVIHCDRTTRRAITKLLRAEAGGKDMTESQQQVKDYDGAKIITLSENHKKLPVFKTDEKRGTATNTRSLYVVRYGGATDEEYVQGIRGKTFMKLRNPVNLGERVRDVIDSVLGICDFGDNAFMRIGGITIG